MEISIFASYMPQWYKDGLFATEEEAVQYGASLGITAAEVFTNEFNERSPEAYKKLLNGAGIRLGGLIATTQFVNPDDAVYHEEFEKLKHWVDTAAELEAETVMVVPFCDWVKSDRDKAFAMKRMICGMRELVLYAKPLGVTICMENFSLQAYPYSLTEDVISVFEAVPGLHYIMDAANLYCVRGDIFKLYEAMKSRIYKMHIKDWKEDPYGCIVRPMLPQLDGCAIGAGLLPTDELMRRLAADGFSGDLIIEVNSDIISTKVIADSAAYLKQHM